MYPTPSMAPENPMEACRTLIWKYIPPEMGCEVTQGHLPFSFVVITSCDQWQCLSTEERNGEPFCFATFWRRANCYVPHLVWWCQIHKWGSTTICELFPRMIIHVVASKVVQFCLGHNVSHLQIKLNGAFCDFGMVLYDNISEETRKLLMSSNFNSTELLFWI